MNNSNYQELRDGGQAVTQGLIHLESLFHAINLASRDALERTDPTDTLGYIDSLSDLGANHASLHSDRMSDLNDIIDELDQPKIDMMKSALQADCIEKSLSALCQIIPEDQLDTLGAIKTVLKLAHDLSMHLASGGRYKYVLKEALDESREAKDE